MEAMRHRRSLLLVPAVSLVAFWAASLSAVADDAESPGVLLRYQFEPGQKIYYSVVNGSHIVVQYDVNQHEVAHSSASVKHFRVVDVFENGTAVLQLTIDRAYMRAEQGGDVAVYDSASSQPAPEEFVGVDATVGHAWVNVTVSPLGEIVEVQTLLAGADQTNISNEVQNNVLSLLPENPVQVGESWSEQYTVGVQIDTKSTLQREIRMQRTFTLTAIEEGRAIIDMRTISLSPVRDPFQEGQLLQRSPSGTLVFDIASGSLVSRDLVVDGEAVGFSGPQSCMSVDSTRNERLIDAEQMDAFFVQEIAAQNAESQAAAVEPAPAQ
jgi:hypothetical protein